MLKSQAGKPDLQTGLSISARPGQRPAAGRRITSMSEREHLLQGILDHPDDVARRLVYADWLQEHGEDLARAEFIRVQCQLADMPIYDRRRPALIRREYELFRQGGDAWSA